MNINIIKAMTNTRKDKIQALCKRYNLDYNKVSETCGNIQIKTKCGILESVTKLNNLLKEGWTLEYINHEIKKQLKY